jgi:uncharacterized damage-inducible protein DinB
MSETRRLTIDLAPEYRSREAASFVAQLNNQSDRLKRHSRNLDRNLLAWQIAPGVNTIGMLMTHMAIWEVYWIRRVLENDPNAEAHVESVLGINTKASNMPIEAKGNPPASLFQDIAFFDDLLKRARDYTTKVSMLIEDGAMEVDVDISSDGDSVTATPRWALYHVLEHFCGHFGQMLLLRNQVMLLDPITKP